jgi:hypothetical protein
MLVKPAIGHETVVSEVARRHDISPQHLFGWRKAARAGQLTLPMDDPLSMLIIPWRGRIRFSDNHGRWLFIHRTRHSRPRSRSGISSWMLGRTALGCGPNQTVATRTGTRMTVSR